MVSGIYFVLRTGLPWRDLPKEFGPWSSVYTRIRRWCRSERWSQMLALLTIAPCSSLRSVDCTHIKAHQDASNAAGGAAAAEEKTEFTIMLDDAGAEKVKVIKVVREITGLGLKEAKDLVDGAPKLVKEAVAKAEAEEFVKKLKEAGAKASLK